MPKRMHNAILQQSREGIDGGFTRNRNRIDLARAVAGGRMPSGLDIESAAKILQVEIDLTAANAICSPVNFDFMQNLQLHSASILPDSFHFCRSIFRDRVTGGTWRDARPRCRIVKSI